jgi:hypothetical protein
MGSDEDVVVGEVSFVMRIVTPEPVKPFVLRLSESMLWVIVLKLR